MQVLTKGNYMQKSEENLPSASNYSFSGDQRYLMQEEELKLSPSPLQGDDSESGSFLNFKIKLQSMDKD